MSLYNIIRSQPLPASGLRPIIDALQARYRALHFEAWGANKTEFPISLRWQLMDVRAFKNRIIGLIVKTHIEGSERDAQFAHLLQCCDRIRAKAGGMSWDVRESPNRIDRDGLSWRHDYSFAVGSAQDGYWTRVSVSSESPIYKDTQRRLNLFRHTVQQWGLQDQVAFESHDDDFKISVRPPLVLRYLDNKIGNLNPTDFRISGLSSLREAIDAARAARDVLSKQVVVTRFGCTLSREQYDTNYKHFNAAHNGWIIEVRGSLTHEAQAILDGGELTDNSPEWIPAFLWWEDEAGARIYGSVVIENAQRYVEIATDGGTLELLQDRVSLLKDVRFEPVFTPVSGRK